MENVEDLVKEVNQLEQNIQKDKINIIIIKIENNEIVFLEKKKQSIFHNLISTNLINKIISKIKDIYCDNNYKIKYLLTFEINKDINYLENLNQNDIKNHNNYNIKIFNQIKSFNYNNNFFTNTNSIIFILNKLEKKNYIKTLRKKNNATKKKYKSNN